MFSLQRLRVVVKYPSCENHPAVVCDELQIKMGPNDFKSEDDSIEHQCGKDNEHRIKTSVYKQIFYSKYPMRTEEVVFVGDRKETDAIDCLLR